MSRQWASFVIPTLAALFISLPSLSVAASAEPTASCGYLVTLVMMKCGQPEMSEPQTCCEALTMFNEASCWCHPAAYNGMTSLASNQYGYIGREKFCKIKNLKAPQIGDREGICQKNTCPKDFNLPKDGTGEVDGDNKSCSDPASLREKREQVISALESLYLKENSKEAIADFKKKTEKLFLPDAIFMSIGMTIDMGSKYAIDYILSRQEKLDSTVPWIKKDPAPEVISKVWSSPPQVSYLSRTEFYNRAVYIGFAPCSEKILELIVDEGALALTKTQFYYPKETEIFGQYNLPAKKICDKISQSCKDLNPFKSAAECESFMTKKKDAKQVLCNNFKNKKLFPFALHGDTTSCRYQYALMAAVDPKKYCPFVGEKPLEMCSTRMCPKNYYDDMFLSPGPRYIASSPFSTSDKGCTELWPESEVDFP